MSTFKRLYREGNQLKLEGGEPARLFIVEQFGFSHYPNREIIKFIDAVANNGGNGIRVFGFFPMGKGRETEPYIRTGSRFDMNRPNNAYFDYLHQWMTHALNQGIVVLYELFDSVGLKSRDLAEYHPFGQFTDGNLLAFSKLSDRRLVDHQKGYLNQVVNVLKQYPNVIFGIINEYDKEADENWHYEMSKHVKALAPQHLIAGSAHDSPAARDSRVDIWFIHTASYDRNHCRSNVGKDVADIRPRVGNKVVGYSTDGFGTVGVRCENPQAMSDLARDVKANNLQIFCFLDHKAYFTRDDSGREHPLGARGDDIWVTALADRANTATYRAISEVFQPTPLGKGQPGGGQGPGEQLKELPRGFVGVFRASRLAYNHPDAFMDRGGVAVKATLTKGYLCYGQYVTGYPAKLLDVYFSLYIDNNTADDANILVLDVYDSAQDKVLISSVVSRRQFPKAGSFNLLKLSFTPSAASKLEFRVYYLGFAYIVVDKIVVVEPDQLQLREPSDIPDLHVPLGISPVGGGSPTGGESPTGSGSSDGFTGIFGVADLPSTHPDVKKERGGKAIKATTIQGFLCYGPYVTNYPTVPLEACFSIYIDNNTADDARILALDVYDANNRTVLTNTVVTRQQFPKAGAFNLFKLPFTPLGNSKLEFRIFYYGFAYIAADKIAVVDPEKIQVKDPSEIPDPKVTEPEPTPEPIPTPTPVPVPPNVIFQESLKDGRTVGRITDGNLTANGVQLKGGRGSIRYTIPTTARGFVEFSVKGLVQDELHGGSEYKPVLFSMCDDRVGFNYDNATFIFEFRKYGFIQGRPDASNSVWFKIKSRGEWSENPRKVLSWDPNRNYRFRIEWGSGQTRAFRDNQSVAGGVYAPEFAPSEHRIQIGANDRREGPHNILISDVVIGKL